MRLIMRSRRHRQGLTLVEAMLLLVIVSIVAVATGVGLQAVVKVPDTTNDMMTINNTLVNVLEQMEAQLTGSSPGWPSTSTTTAYSLPLPNTNASGGVSTYALTTSAPLNTTDGIQTVVSFSTPTSTSSLLAINNKNYQLTVSVYKADPALAANPLPPTSASSKSDFLEVAVQIAPVSGGTAGGVIQTLVTYVTKR